MDKVTQQVMFSSKTELWETPQDLFDKLNEKYHFDCDVCAIPENAKCKKYYTPEIDGLLQNWGVLVGVILHMAERSSSGSKKHTQQALGMQLLSCYYQHEQTQNGSTNTFCLMQIYISLKGG